MTVRTWPMPTLEHVCRLTDDCGIIQHAKFWFPDYATGYCVDDNSRALIVACRHYRLFNDTEAHELMVRYLAFLYYVLRPDGKVRNFIDYSRAFLEDEGSPDSLGRTVWALGHVSTFEMEYIAVPSREMFHRAISHITPEMPTHTLCYGLLGLCAYGERDEARDEAQRLAEPLVAELYHRYQTLRSDQWDWVLPMLTYDNARFPQALIRTGHLLGQEQYIATGLTSLAFLNDICYRRDFLSLVGCHGWFPRWGTCADYDQQPIDAGSMVEVNLDAYTITRDASHLEYAVQGLQWFYGENLLGMPLYNASSGGCHDGLQEEGVNENQGAESTLAHLQAQLQMYEVAPERFGDEAPAVPLEDEEWA